MRWTILVLMFVGLIAVSGIASAITTEVLFSDDFNTLDTTVWDAQNYSYYGVVNSELYAKYIPYGNTISDEYALKSVVRSKGGDMWIVYEIWTHTDSAYATSSRYYFYMDFSVNGYIFEIEFNNKYLKFKYRTLQGYWFSESLYNAPDDEKHIFILHLSKDYFAYEYRNAVGSVSKSEVISMQIGDIQYGQIKIYWWWKKNGVFTGNYYNVTVDKIVVSGLTDSEVIQNKTIGKECNRECLLKTWIEDNREILTGAMMFVGLSFIVAMAITPNAGYRVVFGVIGFAIFSMMLLSMFGVVIIQNPIAGTFVGVGLGFLVGHLMREGVFEDWGLEMALVMFLLAFLFQGVI